MSKANEEIGLQIYTIRHELAEDLTGTLKKVSEIGYRKLEGAGYRDGLYFGLPPKEFKKILDDHDLYLISGHVNTGRKEPDLKGTMTNQFELAIEHAQLMGQKYLVLAYLESFERESIKDYYDLIPLINRCAEIAMSDTQSSIDANAAETARVESRMEARMDRIEGKLDAILNMVVVGR